MTFDLDHVWPPATDQPPTGTTWLGGALDVTDVELGRLPATHARATLFAWEPWTVDALAAWFDHGNARACDVPDRVAAAAGLSVEVLTPALAGRHEPASHVMKVVRALAATGVTAAEMVSVIPGVFA